MGQERQPLANRTLYPPGRVIGTTAAEPLPIKTKHCPVIISSPPLPISLHVALFADSHDQMSSPSATRGRTFGPHQSALHVDETPVGRDGVSPRPGISRFSLGRIPFVSQLMRRWGKGRDERSQSRPPPPLEQPPIPSALTPAIESDSSPLPTLSMVVLSIVCPPRFVRTRWLINS